MHKRPYVVIESQYLSLFFPLDLTAPLNIYQDRIGHAQ